MDSDFRKSLNHSNLTVTLRSCNTLQQAIALMEQHRPLPKTVKDPDSMSQASTLQCPGWFFFSHVETTWSNMICTYDVVLK